MKAMFFEGSFSSLKEFSKQFNIHLRIRSQGPKRTISSESIKFLVKKYYREVIKMLSKILYLKHSNYLPLPQEENESSMKTMFFDGSFFFFKGILNTVEYSFVYQISKTKNYRYLRKDPN